MNTQSNPFVRGYQGLTSRRVLMIIYEDDCPAAYRPLHPSQAQLSDDELKRADCIFCDCFALITAGHEISDELEDKCKSDGSVCAVLYEITADDFGAPVHVGDCYTSEWAHTVIERLSFQTGHYSRCWEISSSHLPRQAVEYLERLAASKSPAGLLFEPFRVPISNAVGCKLYCTPWNSTHLKDVDCSDPDTLRQEQRDADVPQALIEVLHLAAQADVRILIFDPDATVLEGLPVHDE